MELDDQTTAALRALLAKANDARHKKNWLTFDDVVRVVEDARASPIGIATRHGGTHVLSDKTTICLGVVPAGRPETVVIGVACCEVSGASPGRAWRAVQPWSKDLAKNVARAQAWAAEPEGANDRVIVVPRAGKTVVAKVDRAALLAEVLAHPEDDGVRLIYADHLISTGDPRGELIAVQVKLATTPPRQRKQLVARETALLRAHRRTWTKEASQVAKRWEIRRGFVAKVEATCQAFASDGAALMAREPVEELVLSAPTTPGLLALAGAAHVARLRAIELDKFWVRTAKDAAVLNAFLRSPHVAQVPRLALRLGFARGRGVPDPGTLFDGVVLSNVRELAVSWLRSELGPQADNLVAGLAAVKAPALVRVRIGGTPAQRKVIAAAFPNAALDPAT